MNVQPKPDPEMQKAQMEMQQMQMEGQQKQQESALLLKMILFQALIVGVIGYGLGVGLASAWGALLRGRTQIAFYLPWQLLVITAAAVLFICLSAAALSIRKVMKLEPAVVFRS